MVEKLKKVRTLKGWRTIGFNVTALAPFALDIVGYLLGYPGLQNLVPPEYNEEYILGMGVANLVLRYMTTTGVGEKY